MFFVNNNSHFEEQQRKKRIVYIRNRVKVEKWNQQLLLVDCTA